MELCNRLESVLKETVPGKTTLLLAYRRRKCQKLKCYNVMHDNGRLRDVSFLFHCLCFTRLFPI